MNRMFQLLNILNEDSLPQISHMVSARSPFPSGTSTLAVWKNMFGDNPAFTYMFDKEVCHKRHLNCHGSSPGKTVKIWGRNFARH